MTDSKTETTRWVNLNIEDEPFLFEDSINLNRVRAIISNTCTRMDQDTIQMLTAFNALLQKENRELNQQILNEKARADALQTRLDEYVAEVVAAYVDTPLKL